MVQNFGERRRAIRHSSIRRRAGAQSGGGAECARRVSDISTYKLCMLQYSNSVSKRATIVSDWP